MSTHIERGSPTSVPVNVSYRLGKLQELGILKGIWLDCGCADGGYTVEIARRGIELVIGTDIELERLIQARQEHKYLDRVSYVCAASEGLPFSDMTFDGVFINEVLEHVSDELLSLREIWRVLRPGGIVAVMSPNRWFPFEGHGMRLWGKFVNVPIPLLPWLPSSMVAGFMRARNYWPSELIEITREAGFEILATSPVFPVFEVYPWAPSSMIRVYRRIIPILEMVPIIRCFGISTFVLARRPVA